MDYVGINLSTMSDDELDKLRRVRVTWGEPTDDIEAEQDKRTFRGTTRRTKIAAATGAEALAKKREVDVLNAPEALRIRGLEADTKKINADERVTHNSAMEELAGIREGRLQTKQDFMRTHLIEMQKVLDAKTSAEEKQQAFNNIHKNYQAAQRRLTHLDSMEAEARKESVSLAEQKRMFPNDATIDKQKEDNNAAMRAVQQEKAQIMRDLPRITPPGLGPQTQPAAIDSNVPQPAAPQIPASQPDASFTGQPTPTMPIPTNQPAAIAPAPRLTLAQRQKVSKLKKLAATGDPNAIAALKELQNRGIDISSIP